MAVFLCLVGVITVGLIHFRIHKDSRFPLFCIYALLLSLMVSLASVQAPMFFAGAVLFAISDGMLAYMLAGHGNRRLDYTSLGLYYLGQFLLGLAVFQQGSGI